MQGFTTPNHSVPLGLPPLLGCPPGGQTSQTHHPQFQQRTTPNIAMQQHEVDLGVCEKISSNVQNSPPVNFVLDRIGGLGTSTSTQTTATTATTMLQNALETANPSTASSVSTKYTNNTKENQIATDCDAHLAQNSPFPNVYSLQGTGIQRNEAWITGPVTKPLLPPPLFLSSLPKPPTTTQPQDTDTTVRHNNIMEMRNEFQTVPENYTTIRITSGSMDIGQHAADSANSRKTTQNPLVPQELSLEEDKSTIVDARLPAALFVLPPVSSFASLPTTDQQPWGESSIPTDTTDRPSSPVLVAVNDLFQEPLRGEESRKATTKVIKRKDIFLSSSGSAIENTSCRHHARPEKMIKTEYPAGKVLHTPDEVTDLTKHMGDWQPFVKRVTQFLEEENVPFEYVDIWVPSNKQEGLVEDNESSAPDSKLSLRNVGHATKGNTDLLSIFTMYHLNKFGDYSEKFSFPPGVGLPGRAFITGEPTWDDDIQKAALLEFPRVNGARKHNVRKGLGIPIFSPLVGRFVVALYTSEEVTKDLQLVQKCYQEFQNYRLAARWELSVESTQHDPVQVNTDEQETLETQKPGFSRKDEGEIAELLGRHMPGPEDTMDNELSSIFLSLRLLLLRSPSKRSQSENENIKVLKTRYRSSKHDNGLNSNDLAMILADEWSSLVNDRTWMGRICS